MNPKYFELREKYSTFNYNSFEIVEDQENIVITYDFEIEGLTSFQPKWIFKKPDKFNYQEKKEQIDRIVFNLGMVEVISYLKCVCSKRLVVRAGALTEESIKWWKKLYINGLGEFFYVNNITEEMNADTFLSIECEQISNNVLINKSILKGNIIPVGGGKDSLVTLNVLKPKKEENTCYVVNQREATRESMKISNYEGDDIYEAKRFIDPKLIELNSKGFLNGHTPFSAILAFSSYLVAVMMDKKYIILSNEASANEANIEGTEINHQYSKSTEFENDFREYAEKYMLINGPEYFSLLRPFSEWQIVRAFSKLEECFGIFKSCNVGSKQDIWCEKCPKCLYVYIMMRAFLNDEKMQKIFKNNMLNDIQNRELFEGLIYPDKNKPFECVGTKEEINLAIHQIIESLNGQNLELPILLKEYQSETYNLKEEIQKAMNSWNEYNFVPVEFEIMLKEYIGG